MESIRTFRPKLAWGTWETSLKTQGTEQIGTQGCNIQVAVCSKQDSGWMKDEIALAISTALNRTMNCLKWSCFWDCWRTVYLQQMSSRHAEDSGCCASVWFDLRTAASKSRLQAVCCRPAQTRLPFKGTCQYPADHRRFLETCCRCCEPRYSRWAGQVDSTCAWPCLGIQLGRERAPSLKRESLSILSSNHGSECLHPF